MFLLLLESAVNKWRTLPETVVDLKGRTVIVTGSNVGLGLEAAKRFYAMNPARLILAVRTVSKGETAKRSILETRIGAPPYGDPRDQTKVDVWQLDLGSFGSVKQFVNKCEAELDRIDILLENAAVVNPGWVVTKDGWESE
jgi:NAD(P)-dependent dehydrogenase (short-subunit alcohol dehydrogenase family)